MGVLLDEQGCDAGGRFVPQKQALKLCDPMSHNANGIRREIWTALSAQPRMRHTAWGSRVWGRRLVRAVLQGG